MDKAVKFFKKLSKKEAEQVSDILLQVQNGNIKSLDCKQLKGFKNLFRVRVGTVRIIFKRGDTNTYQLVFLGRRSDITYKNLN